MIYLFFFNHKRLNNRRSNDAETPPKIGRMTFHIDPFIDSAVSWLDLFCATLRVILTISDGHNVDWTIVGFTDSWSCVSKFKNLQINIYNFHNLTMEISVLNYIISNHFWTCTDFDWDTSISNTFAREKWTGDLMFVGQ